MKRPSLKDIARKGGEFYTEYDEETGCKCVFDTESGFCWATADCDRVCKELNKNLQNILGIIK
jgi:hypothetical protein